MMRDRGMGEQKEKSRYLVVEKRGVDCRDEELASVGVGAGVLVISNR